MIRKTSTNLLLGILAAGLVTVPCYGSATQQKITESQNAQKKSQEELSSTQSAIQSLEAKKGDLESYLTELNKQLTDLGNNLQEIETRSEEKQEELTQLEGELADAQAREEEQYESMKLRIQYMYENSAESYVQILLESKSMADFLEQAENISQMTQYDRKMLSEYKETTEEIQAKEASIQKEQAELEKLKQESLDKQDEISALVKSTHGQIEDYESQITQQESVEQSLLTQIAAQEDNINALIKKQKDEEAAAALAQQQAAAQEAAEREAAAQAAASAAQTQQTQQTAAQTQSTVPQEEAAVQTEVSDTGSSNGNTYLGNFRITAYCAGSCCGGHSSGMTASGTAPQEGRTVAMGGVPFGTKLMINGTVYTVEDRGVPYGHVDIYFTNHQDALNFGTMMADVYQVN